MSVFCEACGIAAPSQRIDLGPPESLSELCGGCAERALNRSLRPREWFRLAALFGPQIHLLHDDFYSENGKAHQPLKKVVDAKMYPVPTLPQSIGRIEALIDYGVTRRGIRTELLQAFKRHQPEDILQALRIRVSDRPSASLKNLAFAVCATSIGGGAEDWIRGQWDEWEEPSLKSLAHASSVCLPHGEGMTRVMEALVQLPEQARLNNLHALSCFRSPQVLDWIEENIETPVGDIWGGVAAQSQISWSRITAWLESGRPLSLVALDALDILSSHPSTESSKACLLDLPPLAEAIDVLGNHLKRDPVPRVRIKVQSILDKWTGRED